MLSTPPSKSAPLSRCWVFNRQKQPQNKSPRRSGDLWNEYIAKALAALAALLTLLVLLVVALLLLTRPALLAALLLLALLLLTLLVLLVLVLLSHRLSPINLPAQA